MRYVLIASITVSLALTACSSPVPTDANGYSGVLQSKGNSTQEAVSVPLRGECDATMAQPIFVSPGVIRQIDSGTCRLARLGRVAFHSDKVINVIAGSQTTQLRLTAANGDVLDAVGRGTNVPAGPGMIAFITTLTFVGGTGRFDQATGEARVVGQANLIARTSTLRITGRISYEASDRADR